MMTELYEIKIIIPGEGIPERRPRVTKYGTHRGKRSAMWREWAQVYIKKAIQEHEKAQNRPSWNATWFPKKTPVMLQVVAVYACPQKDYRARRPIGRRKHVNKRADGDNVLKAVMDAGTGLLWYDDAQVSTACIAKWVGAQAELPHVQIIAMIDEVT